MSTKSVKNWIVATLFCLIIAASALCAIIWAKTIDRQMRENLIKKADLIAQTIHTDRIQQLTATDADLVNPEYLRMKQQLAVARSMLQHCRFIYLMGQTVDDTVYIFIDSEPAGAEDESPPGQIYHEVPDEFLQAFATRQAQVVGPITDRWGKRVTALIPLKAHAIEEPAVMLGVDIDAQHWQSQIFLQAGIPAIALALALFTILLISVVAFQKRNRYAGRLPLGLQYMESGIVFSVGIVLTLFLAIIMHQRSHYTQMTAFRQLAVSQTAALVDFFDTLQHTELESLAKFHQTTDDVTEEKFRIFTRYLRRNPALYSWAWLQPVSHKDLPDFEQSARRSGLSDFIVWALDEDGNHRPAPQRDVHYVLSRLEPIRDDKSSLGFDLASDPVRREAIKEAIQTRLTTATNPIQLMLSDQDPASPSMIVMRPVFRSPQSQDPLGIAAAALRMADALQATQTDDMIQTTLQLAREDGTLIPLHTLIYDTQARSQPYRISRPIFAFGRTFIVSSHPSPTLLRLYPARGGLITALLGLTISTLLALCASMAQRRAHTLQRLVEERTSDLLHDIEQRKELEAQLQTQNSILRTEQAVSPDAILVVDESDQIISCNQHFSDLCGIPREELLQRASCDTLPRILDKIEDPNKFVARIQDLNQSRLIEEHEEIICRNGMILERFSYPIITDAGSYHGRAWYYRNITNQKRQEQYSELSRNILEILNTSIDFFESANIIINEIKKQTGIDAVGIRLQQEEDFPYIAQVGLSDEFVDAEYSLIEKDRHGDVCRNPDGTPCLECTCGMVLSGETDPSNPLFTARGSAWTNNALPFLDLPQEQDPRHNPRNTCIHQGYKSIALIPIRTTNQIVGILHLNDHRENRFTPEIIDILENISIHLGSALMRKQVEDQLAQNEARLNLLFSESPVSIMVHDKDTGAVIDANKTAWLSYGYQSLEELLQANIWCDPPYSQKDVQQWNHKAVTEGEQRFEWMSRKKDGTIFWEVVALRKITFNGVTRVLATATDITQQKQAEEDREALQRQLLQAQKLESIGRLAGGVAHDFNNMLQAIIGNTELALEHITPQEDIHTDLQEIRKCAQRSTDLTRQLLAFARQQTIAPKVIDINETLESMFNMLRRLIGENVKLTWLPGKNLPTIMFDPAQIDQILVNLCINACDAMTNNGHITIKTERIELTASDRIDTEEHIQGDYIMLSVSDNGHGMDTETLNQVFEPFFTTKKTGEGTGLGLPSVYGAVKQNHGMIKIESEVNKGTCVKILIPASTQPCPPKQEETASNIPTGAGTILLVEDDRTILSLTKRLLVKLGYTVITAQNPIDAIKYADEHDENIDLLITDVIMPDMNGRELANTILSKYTQMKVLFMSGYTADIISQQGIMSQDTYFLQKPFSRKELSEALQHALE